MKTDVNSPTQQACTVPTSIPVCRKRNTYGHCYTYTNENKLPATVKT